MTDMDISHSTYLQGKDADNVVKLNAERRRRIERKRWTDSGHERKLKYLGLPLIGPNRLPVEYLKAA